MFLGFKLGKVAVLKMKLISSIFTPEMIFVG